MPRLEPLVPDPVWFFKLYWPRERLYQEQEDIAYSLRDNDETYAPAANMMGKDYDSGWLALWAFWAHTVVRVITTSVKDDHLRVLWGEIDRFLKTSREPIIGPDRRPVPNPQGKEGCLLADNGGPFVLNHRDVRKLVGGRQCSISYLRGMVSEKGEGLAGHHAPSTFLFGDEASGLADQVHTQGSTWAGGYTSPDGSERKRMLWIGNCNPCVNFFYTNVEAGDRLSADGTYYYRKVVRIPAECSPNVRLALAQQRQGQAPTGETVLPGVLSYPEYVKRRATWDPMRQCIGLDARFWKGKESLLFPPDWLLRAKSLAQALRGRSRKAKGIGCDPAEGGDDTSLAAVDEFGLIDMVSMKTPDTNVIEREVLAFCQRHGVAQDQAFRVCIDRGGGGKQLADRLRARGWNVRTVAFGEAVTLPPRRGLQPLSQRKENAEERYAYVNRRAQLYGELSLALDPSTPGPGFAIAEEHSELLRQLALIPRVLDPEGRLKMLSKDKRAEGSKEQTLRELLGCSPDEADACTLALFAMQQRQPVVVGAVG